MTGFEFHPEATRRIRLMVAFLVTGIVLEAVTTFPSRWPNATGPLEPWRAAVSPAIWLLMGLVFAGVLARLTPWVYWLALMLWLPFVFIGAVVVLTARLWPSGQHPSVAVLDVLGYVAIGCYVGASLLLLSRGVREAYRVEQPGAAGGAT